MSKAVYKLEDKKSVIEMMELLASEEVVNTLKQYNDDTAIKILYHLIRIAYHTRDKESVIEASKAIRRLKKDKFAEEVAFQMSELASQFKNKNAVRNMCKAIIRNEDNIIQIMVRWIDDILREYWNKEEKKEIGNRISKMCEVLALEEVANTFKEYKNPTATKAGYTVMAIGYFLEDENCAIEVCKAIREHTDDETVIHFLNIIDCYTSSLENRLEAISKIIKITKMFEKVGKDIADVSHEEIDEIIDNQLDKLVKDGNSLKAVVTYINFKKELPPLTENNIDDYLNLALDYVKKKYRFKRNITYNEMVKFLHIKEDIREIVVDLVNKSKEINPRYYSLSNKKTDFLNYSKEELKKYAIISVVGSRNKDLEKEAKEVISEIVGERAINKARSEFYKKYKHLIKDIIKAFNKGNYEEVIKILQQTNNEFIVDVINCVNYRDININSNVIKAVESKNPLDYDNRVQMACVYLPYGIHIEDGILEYCKDDGVKLIRYDIGDQTLGSAICYLEDKKLLVDSVEGHRRFRKKEIFEIVYNDLIERAKEWGAEIVIFNTKAMNETPREFIKYLRSKNLKEGNIEMKLYTKAYLEARNTVTGKMVNGFIVKVSS